MTNNLPIALQNPSMTRAIPDSTLVVFDERVSDIEILSQALLPGSIGFTICAQSDGLETITNLLTTTRAKYLAIVAHGAPGVVHLGNNSIDLAQIQAQSHLLQSWSVTEIALYSCQVAKDDIGKDLIYQLSELTGATVAAAATKTGNPTLGGNWDLAITTGEITAPMLFESSILATYQVVLNAVGVLAGTTPIEGGLLGTFDITLDNPASAEGLVVNFTTTGTTATPNIDYTLIPGAGLTAVTATTFTIAAGATKATLTVVANRDAVIDPNEVITIQTNSIDRNNQGFVIGDFIPRTSFEVGNYSNSVTVGDFNGDGKIDLATANQTYPNSTVSLLLGDGNGGFGAKTDFAVGKYVFSVISGDFNGDKKLDLVAANFDTNDISLLFGDGKGSFADAVSISMGADTGPQSVISGDFNGDNKLDLAIANTKKSTVSVLIGNGGGSFNAITPLFVGNSPKAVNVGYFNGDSYLDLVTANYDSGTISLLFGNGVGGFADKIDSPVGLQPISVSVGDFNGDGKLDLATANRLSSTVSVLLGDGKGGLSRNDFAVGESPYSIIARDLNGDNKIDLAVANYYSDTVSVLLGNGSGDFAAKTDFIAGNNPTSVSTGDFNGDGKPDLAIANYQGSTSTTGNVSILRNNYDHTASLSIVDNPIRNDFDGDQKSDILWRSDVGGVALWTMNGATVTTSNLTSIPSRAPSWKVAGTGDFNADTKADILWRNDSGAIEIWTMNGSQVIAATPTSTPFLDPKWETVGTGDFTGDGKTDILWRNTNLNDNRVVLWTMDGANVVDSKSTSTPTLDKSWKAAGTGDFNGDGKSDILWRNDDGSIALWQMNGTNVSSKLTSTPSLDNSWKINGTADFNGDGKTDVLWRKDSGEIAIWTMDGTNVSSQRTSTPSLDNSWQINGTGDFNGDGKADILWRKDNGITDPTTDIVAVWTMDGTNILSSTLTSVQPDSKTWKVAPPIL
jgi:Domain of unknown function (DUF4347)/FG-GAP-like repeat